MKMKLFVFDDENKTYVNIGKILGFKIDGEYCSFEKNMVKSLVNKLVDNIEYKKNIKFTLCFDMMEPEEVENLSWLKERGEDELDSFSIKIIPELNNNVSINNGFHGKVLNKICSDIDLEYYVSFVNLEIKTLGFFKEDDDLLETGENISRLNSGWFRTEEMKNG